MKNLFKAKILADINSKLEELENSFVEISWNAIEKKERKEKDFIGLYDNRKFFLKKCYTFSPL